MSLASRETIENFIPQRFPMVMIDSLLKATDTEAVTEFRVQADNIFADGVLSESGLVENIAQTAAAHVGFVCAQKKLPVPIGYIAAVKNLRIVKLPVVNSVITTSVKITNQVLDVTVAQAETVCDAEVICSCEMRIFIKS